MNFFLIRDLFRFIWYGVYGIICTLCTLEHKNINPEISTLVLQAGFKVLSRGVSIRDMTRARARCKVRVRFRVYL